MQSAFGASCVRARRLAQFSRAAWHRPSGARDQFALRLRTRELTQPGPAPAISGLEHVGLTVGARSWMGAKASTAPRPLTVDHGTEFQLRALEDWSYRRCVQLDFIRPGKPIEIAFIEASNGRLRDGCLNVRRFASMAEAQSKIGAWRLDYDQCRPHSSPGHLTPNEFVEQRQARRRSSKKPPFLD